MQALRLDSRIEDMMAAAARALAGGDAATARATLNAVVARAPDHVPAWLNLAAAARVQGDLNGALAAIDGALAAEPRNFFALLGRASVLERLGHARAAAVAFGVAVSQAPPEERLDPASRHALQHAREVNGRYMAELEEHVVAALDGAFERGEADAERKAAAFLEVALRKRRIYRQEPVEFFWPGLPAIEFYDRKMFPWIEAFEAAANDIRDELIAVLRDDAGAVEPYVDYPDSTPLDQWRELNHSLSWGAYHLLRGGERVEENCRRTPKTMAAVGLLPQPDVAGRSPSAMFSVLQPRTRIPPHTGISNTRLVLHLPLIVPDGCGFRVGAETRQWREGEAWVFDDTIEHEAWNESDQRRVILICDIWSPFLSELDREVIRRVMSAMDEFNQTTPQSGL